MTVEGQTLLAARCEIPTQTGSGLKVARGSFHSITEIKKILSLLLKQKKMARFRATFHKQTKLNLKL